MHLIVLSVSKLSSINKQKKQYIQTVCVYVYVCAGAEPGGVGAVAPPHLFRWKLAELREKREKEREVSPASPPPPPPKQAFPTSTAPLYLSLLY